tara:strand:- start:104 stop:262 length:159 start_codon:yes stop_codon:yes gene_type:complete
VSIQVKQESYTFRMNQIKLLYVYKNLYNPNINDPVKAQPIAIATQKPKAGKK